MATAQMPTSNDSSEEAEKPTREEMAKSLATQRVSTAKVEKQSIGKKFASTFFSEDIQDIKSYIWYDVIIPSFKKIISESINNATDMLLYGDKKPSNIDRNRGTSYVSYSSQYRYQQQPARYAPSNRDPRQNPQASRGCNPEIITFDHRSDAEDVLSNLVDLVELYHMASISDFYSLAGLDSQSNYMDRRWGWMDLSNARVVRYNDAFIIDLPRTIELDV